MSENETGNRPITTDKVANVHAVHAHRCENCAKNGTETVWMHGDEKAADIAAHSCPKCGTVEWKKYLVRPARFPQAVQQKASAINLDKLLEYVAILVAVILVIKIVQWLAEPIPTDTE
jgi:formate dehydrogenase maturation protein FdhE